MILVLRAGSPPREGRLTGPAGRPVEFREISLIQLSPVEGGVAELQGALDRAIPGTWVLFTSANTITFLSRATPQARGAWAALRGSLGKRPLAVVGPSSERRAREAGLRPAFVPSVPSAVEISQGLQTAGARHIVWPRSRASRLEIQDEMLSLGMTVQGIPVYEEIPDPGAITRVLELLIGDRSPGPPPRRGDPQMGRVDAVGFTSPAVVETLAAKGKDLGWEFPDLLQGTLVGAIGQTTARALKERGCTDVCTCARPVVDALLELLVHQLASRARPVT